VQHVPNLLPVELLILLVLTGLLLFLFGSLALSSKKQEQAL